MEHLRRHTMPIGRDPDFPEPSDDTRLGNIHLTEYFEYYKLTYGILELILSALTLLYTN